MPKPKPKPKTKAEQRLATWNAIKDHVDRLWPATTLDRHGFEVVEKSPAQVSVGRFDKQFLRMYKAPDRGEWDGWLDRLEATIKLYTKGGGFDRGSKQEDLASDLLQLTFKLNRLGPD